MTSSVAPARPSGARRDARGMAVGVAAVAVLLALAVLSVFVGSGDLTTTQVLAALTGEGDGPVDIIVREYRVPRTLLAIVVGGALGVAGTVIQALTRNPLADPGILGVNAGAYAAIVLAAASLGPVIGLGHVVAGMTGALITALVVYVIGSTGPAGGTPAKLVLTGVALGAVLTGASFAVTLVHPSVFDRVRFWHVGSLQGRSWGDLWAVTPAIAAGLVVALLLPRALNALALGDDVAVAVGSRPPLTRVAGMVSITLLCGAATAAAGPIAFIGLLTPHALRTLVGPDHRRLVPLSVLAAAILLLGADVLGRVLTATELPAGVVTALVGAPVLIALARRDPARRDPARHKGARGL